MALVLGGCSRHGDNLPVITEVLSTTTILAENAEELKAGDDSTHGTVIDLQFGEYGWGVAYTYGKDEKYHVVHNGVPGKEYQEILYLRLSRDGKRIAYGARIQNKWYMIVDGIPSRAFDETGTPLFSPDGKHVLFDARIGDKWHLVNDNKVSPHTCSSFYDKFFSNDSRKIISLENEAPDNNLARVVTTDLEFKSYSSLKVKIAGVKYNSDKTRFAGIMDINGKKRVVIVSTVEPSLVGEGNLYDEISSLSFGRDGVLLSYVAAREGERYLVLDQSEELLSGGEPTLDPPTPRPGQKSVGIALKTQNGSFMHFAFQHTGKPEKRYEEVAFIRFDASGKSYAYGARNGKKMFFVINGKESPAFDKVLAPVFSPDGTRVVARVRKDGKRFVIAMDLDARIAHQYPAYDMVYDTRFTSDGKSVAYGVKDGSKLIWKVEKL